MKIKKKQNKFCPLSVSTKEYGKKLNDTSALIFTCPLAPKLTLKKSENAQVLKGKSKFCSILLSIRIKNRKLSYFSF